MRLTFRMHFACQVGKTHQTTILGLAVIVLAVFAHETLVACPVSDQGAVHTEVFTKEQFLLLADIFKLVPVEAHH